MADGMDNMPFSVESYRNLWVYDNIHSVLNTERKNPHNIVRVYSALHSTTPTPALPNTTFVDNLTDINNDIDSFSQSDYVFYGVYLSGIFILSSISIIGNGLVINAMLKHRQLRVPGNYFILSLACSDMLLGIVYPIYNVSHIDAKEIHDTIGKWA